MRKIIAVILLFAVVLGTNRLANYIADHHGLWVWALLPPIILWAWWIDKNEANSP
jgi:hypothetical protein